MDIGEISCEYAADIERVLSDMREVRKDNDGEEEDDERMSPRDVEKGRVKRDGS